MTRLASFFCMAVTIAVATRLPAQTTYYAQEQDPKTGKWYTLQQHDTHLDEVKYKGAKTAIERARDAVNDRRKELAASGSSVKTRIVTNPNQPGRTTLVQTLDKYKELYAKSPEGAAKLLRQRETLAKQQQELSQERTELQREREDLLLLAGQIATLEGPNADDLLGGKPGTPPNDSDTNTSGETETADEQESADEIKMEYKNRLKKLEQRIEGFNNKVRGYSTQVAGLLQDESKLRYSKSYDDVVVHVADREADKNRVVAQKSVREILENTTWHYRNVPGADTFLPNNVFRTSGVRGTIVGRWRVEGKTITASYVEEPGSVIEVTLTYNGETLVGTARLFQNGKLAGKSPQLVGRQH